MLDDLVGAVFKAAIVLIAVLPFLVAVFLGVMSWRRKSWKWVAPFLLSLFAVVSYSLWMYDLSIIEPSTRSVKDEAKVWDKQVRGTRAYVLVRNTVGFHDIMEGVKLFRYPTSLGDHDARFREKYLVFDEGVKDYFEGKPRYVTSASLDIVQKKVRVKFNRGPGQTIDISKYAL